jgi:hypothetical protein
VIHARDSIRKALAAALAGGGTAAGSRVYDSPTDVRTAWPAIVVEVAGESQTAATLPGGASRMIERELLLDVTVEVQQTTGYATTRESLLADVEAIAASATLPGAKSIVPTGYAPDQTNTGERPIAIGRQRFAVSYITTQGNPAATL